MESGSGGDQADDSAGEREIEQAGGQSSSEAAGAIRSRVRLPKDHVVNDAIGKALQAHYRSLADAPLPDRLLILLAELEAKEAHDD